MSRSRFGRLLVVLAFVLALAVPSAAPASADMACGAPDNPWGFDFYPCATRLIYVSETPPDFCDYFACIASFWQQTRGYVVECGDGMFSHSGGRRGVCSYHDGEWAALEAP
jgi:hypothetical protein